MINTTIIGIRDEIPSVRGCVDGPVMYTADLVDSEFGRHTRGTDGVRNKWKSK